MTLKLSYPSEYIALVTLNRPEKLNAMNRVMYKEIKETFESLDKNLDIRCIVVTGNEKAFCAGMDLQDFCSYRVQDAARGAFIAQDDIQSLQDCITVIETCKKPVIAAVSGFCLGAGVDLMTACCIRLCTKSTLVSIKEIDLGITADLGVLQRLPKIVGNGSWIKEIIYTGRNVKAEECLRRGLVSTVYDKYEGMLQAALTLAEEIATKSPVAVLGSKKNLNFSRDHSVKEALDFVVQWNSWALQSSDVEKAVKGFLTKEKVRFPKL